MQVYIAICNAQDDYIVAKKREFNSLWDGKTSLAGPSLVNQAGQWTLPGGKFEKEDSDFIKAASREFAEETGQKIPDSANAQVVLQNKHYALVRCLVPEAVELMHKADAAIKPFSPDRPNTPKSLLVEDWELQDLTMVPKRLLSSVLGVKTKGQRGGLRSQQDGQALFAGNRLVCGHGQGAHVALSSRNGSGRPDDFTHLVFTNPVTGDERISLRGVPLMDISRCLRCISALRTFGFDPTAGITCAFRAT